MADPLDELAARAGIVGSYTDQTGRRRRTSRETKRAILAAMRLPAASDAEARERLAELNAAEARRKVPNWAVGEPDVPLRGLLGADVAWRLEQEDGTAVEGRGDTLPPLPLGLHSLRVDGGDGTLIVAPRRLPLPGRGWGLMLPLHALRPPQTGGLADYEDLATVAEGLAGEGACFLGLNPIHAGFFADPDGFSPYTPSHRRRLSAFHVAEGVPPVPDGPLVDYATVIPRRRAALESDFARFREAGGDPAFDAFRKAEGEALELFAVHQALSDIHGAYWTDWPAALQDPASDSVAEARAKLADEVTFHAWLQWRARAGLAHANERACAAGMSLGLYLDLAVGTHPSGAETWEDRDSFAYGASLGAPPDAFAADGQSWGLAPFCPRALLDAGFRPLAETLRTQMSLSGAVRIDHILGFDRAFWVPDGGGEGAYVDLPTEAMLAIVRMEAARAGCVVVGEDLGNVPRGFRATLDRTGILGCRLQMFEREPTEEPAFRPPEDYDRRAIASFSSHDLPTWKGWRNGHEIDLRLSLGHIDADFARTEQHRREAEVSAFDAMTADVRPDGADPASADAMHHALAATASVLAMVQVECALGLEEQPNLPGTVREYPNWRQRLPVAPAGLAAHPGIARAAAIMRQRR